MDKMIEERFKESLTPEQLKGIQEILEEHSKSTLQEHIDAFKRESAKLEKSTAKYE